MYIRQLEAFKAVMSTGSVSRAAELLCISQPAVSQLINQLELYCGFMLFERKGRRLHHTREAEALLVEVELMFAGINRVARVAAALRDKKWGALTIGAFPAIARQMLPEIVSHYANEHPNVMFHIQSMRSRSLIDAVASHQLDFGISFIAGDRDEIESIPLQTLKAVCILPVGHHLTENAIIKAQDLAGEPFISLGPQDRSRMFIDKIFDDLQIMRKMRIETGQSETACSFVALGAGISVVDPISAGGCLEGKLIVRPFEPDITFTIWLIRPRMTVKSGIADHFISFMRKELSNSLT
ncbi:LysR substrate-binding domain-containing protein [Pseudochrobactrum sp. MP213Fo]|uniref:LysR substrate-binding domain-containing protein n=1 Tax=Pseudochrobactrum sp. MP213Fo TaxID=3022250 RepID=UPI003BA123B3